MQVPEILHPLCSKRVLTMEFVTGANVCDKAALARMGLKASDVARLVSKTFNEMIFIFGDVRLFAMTVPQHGAPFTLACAGVSTAQWLLLGGFAQA